MRAAVSAHRLMGQPCMEGTGCLGGGAECGWERAGLVVCVCGGVDALLRRVGARLARRVCTASHARRAGRHALDARPGWVLRHASDATGSNATGEAGVGAASCKPVATPEAPGRAAPGKARQTRQAAATEGGRGVVRCRSGW